MGFAIMSDSTVDWTLEECAARQVVLAPLNIEIDGEVLRDQTEISTEDFYDRMLAAEHLPKTSQPSPHEFAEAFGTLAKEGYGQVVVLTIASVLSGTYQSACLAAADTGIEVRVIDTHSASAGMGLVLRRACDLRDSGASFDEACVEIERTIGNVRFFIACDQLNNLIKGGRLSEGDAFAASLLNVKPVFAFDEVGALKPHDKAKGMKGVVKGYVDLIAERTRSEGTQIVRFCHTRNPDGVERVRRELADAGIAFVDAGCVSCGATVATHLGIGALGIGVCKAW